MDEKIILSLVASQCKKDPQFFHQVIKAAIAGVEEFANKQKDHGSKLGFAMTSVIDSTTQESFGLFKRSELVEMTKPWLEGTTWYKNQTNV
jgi:hypothetical protein